MTPQLRQAIKILQVSRAELETLVDQELTAESGARGAGAPDEKPEVRGADRRRPARAPSEWQRRDARAARTSRRRRPSARSTGRSSPRTTATTCTARAAARRRDDDDDRRPALENTLVKRTLLPDHLIWQLRLSDLSERREGARRAHHRQPRRGRLPHAVARGDRVPRQRLAATSRASSACCAASRSSIRRASPRATSPECLLIQLRQLGLADDSLPARIVRDHLPLLESRRFDKLARELGRPDRARSPRPPRSSPCSSRSRAATTATATTRYVTPDVYIQKVGDEFVVTLNDDGLPRLRVSPFYRQHARRTTARRRRSGYIQEKMRAAAWLIKSIHQRQRTLYMVTLEHREVPARLPRARRLAAAAAGAEGRRQRHRHARVDREPRDRQQVRAHAAGHLRAQVLLHLEPAQRPRRGGLGGEREGEDPRRSSPRKTRASR